MPKLIPEKYYTKFTNEAQEQGFETMVDLIDTLEDSPTTGSEFSGLEQARSILSDAIQLTELQHPKLSLKTVVLNP